MVGLFDVEKNIFRRQSGFGAWPPATVFHPRIKFVGATETSFSESAWRQKSRKMKALHANKVS